MVEYKYSLAVWEDGSTAFIFKEAAKMLGQLLVAVSLVVSANALFDRNLAYRSPFIGYEEVRSRHFPRSSPTAEKRLP